TYTVTADANGGSIPTTTGWTGTGNTATKSVTYNSPYGTLPTPTRDGYIFRGWNGKNYYNYQDFKQGNGYTIDNNGWITFDTSTGSQYYVYFTHNLDVQKNTTYLVVTEIGNISNVRGNFYATSQGSATHQFRSTIIYPNDMQANHIYVSQVTTMNTENAGSDDVGIRTFYSNPMDDSNNRYKDTTLSFRISILDVDNTITPSNFRYEPYYVTSSTNVTQAKDHTLKAIWDLKESTFLSGTQFNAKIKQLAGNQDATYQTADNNITSIVRSNSLTIMPTDDNVVSTSDSNTPTYAWFDSNSGTLYYYTDAVNLYMNSNANYMFYNLRNVNNIDLDDINTTKTTSMYALFHSCLNLSNLDLSNFNTENLQQTRAMFYNCSSLTSIDLSSFDMSKVTDAVYMIGSMSALRSLKTPNTYPTDSSVKITLPKLMVDASGNEYTELDNTSPTETTLYTRSIFIEGPDFNARIKQLANPSLSDVTMYTSDTNITSIVRTNTLSITPTSANIVSTSDSYYPIYAWFNNGTLYYYSESQELYMNSYAYAMFRELTKAVSIDLSGISTKLTTEMSAMFLYDDKLATLDLSNFDTSKVRQMQSMFHSCASLQELDLSSFDLTSITNSGTMFNGMTALKRLKTPEVIPSGKRVVLSKLLVDASGNEYTELNSTTPTETWLYVPATFSSGTEFNAKIKQLAGNNGATYETENTNITSIVRTNTLSITPTSSNIVSTSDSYYPIYTWYNNGVIYYYSEANNLYMNKTATRMFTNLKSVTGIDLSTISTVKSTIFYELFYNDINLETIDVSHFNTSNVTDMQRMFRNCSKIETLNLSNFNTAKVTDMRMMFSGCSSLETLNISSFRTPNVVYMNGMFTYTKLQTLDLSNFDMTKVTNTTDMLRDMSELEQFKTPNIYPSEAVIQMPQTLYDPSGNSWSVLDSSAPTETWLKLEYIPYSISYNLDGGAVSTANPTSYNINSSAITLNNPTRSGYAFAGWSGGKNIQTIPTIYATVTEARNTTIDQMFFIKAGTYTYTRNVDGVSSLRDAIILKDLNGNDLSDSSYSPNNLYYYNTSYQAWIIGTDSTGSTLSRTITIKEDCYIKFVVMFGGSSNTKIISQLEEGTTSTYVDKQTTVTIPTSSTGNRVYTANWTANNYTVTADANGGSIPTTTGWTGTGNTATKSVTYNSSYGTLPEPTRTGYTFKGWNGKNLYDSTKGINGYISNTGEVIGTQYKFNYLSDYIKIETGKQYIISGNTSFYNIGCAFFDNNKTYITRLDNNYTSSAIITPTNNGYIRFWISYDNSTALNSEMISETFNVRLEEGSTATPYEPYYVISSTNVTQAKDHTLKAIWDLKESTLLPGEQFNAKMKQLTGDQDATWETSNTNITSIVRSNSLTIMPTDDNVVSTSSSNTPTYAWFDSNSGTLYYYTDAVNLYMNANAHAMFYNLKNTTSIDLSNINTSKTVNMQSLFNSDSNLTGINVSNFDTSNVTNMQAMFKDCSSLSTLDISSFNTSNVTTMYYMFNNCSALTSLDLSGFDMSNVVANAHMISSMHALKQLKTPNTYPTDSSKKISLKKLMIDSNDNEYKELDNSSPTNTMLYTPATFLPGQEFNAKIKQLAGNQDATFTTSDTNITSIVRSNTLNIIPTSDNVVSTSDSYYPIYAWFNNGTLYYYSESTDVYFNSLVNSMFRELRNVESIDIENINSNQISGSMWAMFLDCYKLESLDLSNFNTTNVTSMQSTFQGCTSLQTLDLSNLETPNLTNTKQMFLSCTSLKNITFGNNFNTSDVTDMYRMFYNTTSLTSLDISEFDMSSATDTTDMLTGMTSLESLKTPNTYPSEAVIQLPKTLYDPSGNGWSVFDSSSPTETWLHKMICKRATTLHTETCSQTSDSLYCSGAGYTVGGSKNTSTITYGSLGTNDSTLNGGDAFTCDVNGDGTFNELTERFYYVGDYYNTTTKEFETDTGVLVYYNNVSAGVANNTATSEYDTSGENWHGPVTAISQLPTTSQWTNVSLNNNTRAILTYNNGSMTDGGTLPNDFSYSGYSARLLTVQEINHSLNRSLSSLYSRLDDVAPYLFENTKYSTPTLNFRWWLESVSTNNASAYSVMTTLSNSYSNGIYSYAVAIPTGISVRPAIEVNKNFLNKKVNAYLITYDTNGGSENTTQTVTVGDSLDSLSVPTREGYTFAGWYTEASGGTQVTTATVPTATTTYYAHWTPIDYNITYNLDGGEVGTANPTTYNPDSNSITLNNPTKTGYTFAGWSGGKNLFNKDATPYYQNSWINESGGRNSEQYYSVYKIPIDENKEYTITHTHTVFHPCYAIFDENDTLLIAEKYSSRKTITFTSPANSKYILVSVITDPTFTPHYDKDIFQLEEGTNATSYEPYVSNETTLTIPSGSVGNRKYIANWTANTYTVTADANGGSIPTTTGWTGTGNTATKSVTYDSPYGTLPTPTRNGYTFKGWNGKNLLNIDKMTNDALINNNDGTYTIWYKSTGRYGEYFDVDIPENTKLIMNYELLEYNGTYPAPLQIVGIGDGNAFYIYDKNSVKNVNINISKIRIYQEGTQPIGTYTKFKNLQLEEGATATPYEPYYITSSTNVTQAKDHTLKAKWEMNTYEITYDLQGGTLASSNPATYNVETNTFTLNNPTLTGQTFIGWTGSNGNTPEVNVTIPVGSYGDKAYVANFSPIYEPETRIRSLNTIGTTIADDDPDSNLRFIGSNPNNYVSFNGQKWRIIGVFNGKLKIIQEPIGSYSWDTSRNTVNNGNGINQWGPSGTYTGADLMKLLNPGYSSNTDLKCNTTITYTDGIYNCGDNTDSNYTSGLVNNSLWWNAESGYCYNNGNYSTTACDFTTTGLQSNTARNMIDNATWYLGSNLGSENVWDGRLTASFAYNFERGNLNGKQCSSGNYCSDDVTRTTTWQGKVGLLYPSDYVYATSGGTTHNRNTCLTVHAGYVADDSNIQNWNNTYTDCKNNDWLFNVSTRSWTISPSAFGNYSTGVFVLNYGGYIYRLAAVPAIPVRPVVYLKSSIKFTTGDGSYNSPFNLIDTE
ncbi:MAG: BspA family leucine-rich repeat surface protein, partial [Bacilli bacterium]|nr:BspA family leucine-rich repeat surface protein [Bacilli bacterium]